MSEQHKGTATEAPVAGAQDAPASGPGSSDDQLRTQVQEIIDEMINPAIAMHGGFIELNRVNDSKVYVSMGGGCQGCAASQMTLRAGIEAMLLEEVPQIKEVIDVTDHDAGVNPYFSE